ncbi:MAG: hypothetical protein AMXMBFR48_27230 [Ignavibacteriales bacterium]
MKTRKTKNTAKSSKKTDTILNAPLTLEELKLLQDKTKRAAEILKKYHPTVKFINLEE